MSINIKTWKDNFHPKEMVKTVLFAIVFAVTFQSIFFQQFSIPSSSMMPNLLVGDRILVNKFVYGYSKYSFPLNMIPFSGKVLYFNKPKHGDVVVFKLPEKGNTYFIKRVIAVPGDDIEIKNGIIYVNGITYVNKFVMNFSLPNEDNSRDLQFYSYIEKNDRNFAYTIQKMSRDASMIGDNFGKLQIPQGKYFVMGDNRDNSNDSRFKYLGLIDEEKIIGKAQIVWMSGNCNWWEFWKWPTQIRLDRIGKRLSKSITL